MLDTLWSGLLRRRLALTLALVLLASYSYFFPRWADWNQNSRFDLVRAIVEDHTLTIDKYVANTGDYAEWNGHTYSDKAPGTALLGVPVYAAYRAIVPPGLIARLEASASDSAALGATLRKDGTGLQSGKLSMFVALTLTTFVTTVVPAVALGVLLFLLAGYLGLSVRASWWAALLYGLATIAFPYANAFVGHQTSAFVLFAAFTALYAIRRGRLGRRWLVLAGFLVGFAAINEYPTVLIGGLIFLYALFTLGRPFRTALLLVAGAVPPLLVLAIHDYLAFGTILPVGYFHSALWQDVHQTGFLSLTFPHPDALWGITFSPFRGLFYLSPYLLFAVPGYIALWRLKGQRAEFGFLLLAPVSFLLFNASSAMWHGGFAVGPRYLVASLPFLGLVAGLGLARAWQRRAAFRPLILLASAWSFFAVWAETIAGQSFPDYRPNPLFDLSLPALAAGDIARNPGMFFHLAGWASLLPLVLVLAIGLAVLWRSAPRPPGVGAAFEKAEIQSRWAQS